MIIFEVWNETWIDQHMIIRAKACGTVTVAWQCLELSREPSFQTGSCFSFVQM